MRPDMVGVDAVAAVDHVPSSCGDVVGAMQQFLRLGSFTVLARQTSECVTCINLDLWVAGPAASVEDVVELADVRGAGGSGVDRGEQALGEEGSFTSSGGLVPAVVLLEQASASVSPVVRITRARCSRAVAASRRSPLLVAGQGGRRAPVRDVELGQDVAYVDAGGSRADDEGGCDLAVRRAVGQQRQHLAFPRGQPV
jgi:hypothetical protein